MNKILTYLILLSLSVLVWYCSNNVTGTNDDCLSAIYSKDSIYTEMMDTMVTCSYGEDPVDSGYSTHNLKLAFVGETNCDSSMGVPYLHVELVMNNTSVYSFTTYSKTEINKQFSLYFNKINTSNGGFVSQSYYFRLYLTSYIAKGITYGKKYILLRNINLWCN